MLRRRVQRVVTVAADVVDVTAVHLRRIVGHVGAGVGRARREVSEMAWEFDELAGELRRSKRSKTRAEPAPDDHLADVVPIDLWRRQAN
jgi:Sec-independent protein translocase protein TatA